MMGRLTAAICVLGLWACQAEGTRRGDITLFAAAGTAQVVTHLVRRFEKTEPERVTLNFASSGALARQIEAGAAADLYLSASPEWLRYLHERGLSDSAGVTLMENRLVAIAPKTRLPLETGERAIDPDRTEGRLAMGDPAHVPAGRYAEEALGRLGFLAGWRDRILPAQSVRAALRAVEMGACDWGIVYLTEALGSSKVEVIYQFPESSHAPIRFGIATVKGHSPEAEKLLRYLSSDAAMAAAEAFGFIPVDAATRR